MTDNKTKPTVPIMPPLRYTDPAYILAQRAKQNIRKIKAFFKKHKAMDVKHEITDEERLYLKHTIALLNSMVISGESHSQSSHQMVQESFAILVKKQQNTKL